MTPRPQRDLTDDELRAISRAVVRAYVEVERGHRDVRALRRFLAPHVYFAVEQEVRRPGLPPVAARDVGGAQFNRIGAGKGYAVVVVRDSDGRWRAMTLALRRNDSGSWHVVEMRRVHPRNLGADERDVLDEDGGRMTKGAD